MKRGSKYKWHFFNPFSQQWEDNGEGVSKWREMGLEVKLIKRSKDIVRVYSEDLAILT